MADPKNATSRSRRNFLKLAAGGAAGVAAVNLGAAFEALASDQERIDAARLKIARPLDHDPIQVNESYQRFNSTNYAFNALARETGAAWSAVSNANMVNNILEGKVGSFIKAPSVAMARLYAGVGTSLWAPGNFFNRTWSGMENMGPQSWTDNVNTLPGLRGRAPDITDPAPLTMYTKTVARMAGAEVVGVGPFDPRWIYTHTQRNQYAPTDAILKEIRIADAPAPEETEEALIIPADAQSVVVMAFSMNRSMMRTSPSPVANALSGMGYWRVALTAVAVADFIRSQGYWAIPSTNCTGLSVPMAIQAGIGEDGRHGLVVTPEFGANHRLSKVITNMPMNKDKPVSFGLREFCDKCGKCAAECPSRAITPGQRSWEGFNASNNSGTFKYYNDLKKCLGFWMENGCSCANCIGVCQGDLWAHAAAGNEPAWIAENIHFVDDYWTKDLGIHGLGRRADPGILWDLPVEPYALQQYSEMFEMREEFKSRLRNYKPS